MTAGLPGNVYFAGPRSTNVLYRVNAGGPLIAATDGGPDWAADATDPSPYRNNGSNAAGASAVPSVNSSVPAGTPAALFTDERWDASGAPEMQWTFPVPTGTHVAVRLYLANRCGCTASVGQRVFSVAIDGATVLSNYDIVADVGNDVGAMKEYTVTSDGTVNIDFTHVVENPLIDAVEIVNLDAAAAVSPDSVGKVSYDGTTTVGALTAVADPTGTTWSGARNAFWVGGQLFYGWSDGKLYKRTFDGTTWGTPALVDPYHDAYWDNVQTGSGQTFAGVTSNFYSQITTNTGMSYQAGRLYYTRSGQNGLYYRWFNPDSGVVSPVEFSVAGSTGFSDSGGLLIVGDSLYLVSRSTGNLTVRSFTGGVPGATVTTVSGPTIDGVDWRAKAVFVGP